MRQIAADVDTLLEDLEEFRGWLAGYEDLVMEADDYTDRLERFARLEEIRLIIDEFDRQVGYFD